MLGVANPKTAEYPNNSDETQDVVEKFLKDNGYTFPVVMDLTGDTFSQYMISAFPTTFMIDKDGNVFGYASGSLSRDMMESIVQQTMTTSASNKNIIIEMSFGDLLFKKERSLKTFR